MQTLTLPTLVTILRTVANGELYPRSHTKFHEALWLDLLRIASCDFVDKAFSLSAWRVLIWGYLSLGRAALNIPVLSLTALLIAILISCVSRLNVGFLSIAFALVIGVFFGGLKAPAVIAGFPTSLFLTLVGITLLFSQARVNGTLDKVAKLSVKLARDRPGMIPIIFFALALILATIGAGHIAAPALLAPVALAIGQKAGVAAVLAA